MATFSLTDLKKAVDQKFAPTIIKNGKTEYRLENVFRLGDKAREDVAKLSDKLAESNDLDVQQETIRELIIKIEANGKGEELLDLLGGDMALQLELVNRWMEATELGEAERS